MNRKEYYLESLATKIFASKQLEDWQIEQLLEIDYSLTVCDAEILDRIKARLIVAKQKGEKVFICGDYDADGICATTILKDALDQYGINTGYYIPNRLNEGYGISCNIVDKAHESGYELIITVDNGVAAQAALTHAKDLGIDVIVTDHHVICEEVLCFALLHPTLLQENFNAMCGAGMALLISQKLIGENKNHVMLAMVATLGDMMPLWHENRRLVRYGLKLLNQQQGYAALELLTDRTIEVWDEKVITFQLVPKFNVIGRLADRANANNLVRYLLSQNPQEQMNFSLQIKALNQERRHMSDAMCRLATSKLSDELFNVVKDSTFHEGIVGLIAGKIANETHKPTCILAEGELTLKGSVRSIPGLDIHAFFQEFDDLLCSFGGHSQAAGIELLNENYEAFVKRIQLKMESIILDDIRVDKEVISIDLKDLTLSSIKQYRSFAPFGQGFSDPLFEIKDLPILDWQTVGKNNYPKWICEVNGNPIEAISFQQKGITLDKTKNYLHVIGSLGLNQFRGREKMQLLVESIQE